MKPSSMSSGKQEEVEMMVAHVSYDPKKIPRGLCLPEPEGSERWSQFDSFLTATRQRKKRWGTDLLEEIVVNEEGSSEMIVLHHSWKRGGGEEGQLWRKRARGEQERDSIREEEEENLLKPQNEWLLPSGGAPTPRYLPGTAQRFRRARKANLKISLSERNEAREE